MRSDLEIIGFVRGSPFSGKEVRKNAGRKKAGRKKRTSEISTISLKGD